MAEIIHIIVSVTALSLIVFVRMIPKYRRSHANFNQQLEIFKKLGFSINKGVSEEDLKKMWGEEAYTKDRFSLLYTTLGSTIEREPWTPITDQAWYFDTEAIENEGDYVKIIKNLERISKSELRFKNISDIIDFDKEEASVSFELNGDKYHYDLEFKDDWVDPVLFTKIVDLTKKYNTKGRFTYFGTDGQSLVVGFSTAKELEQIRKKTGLNIVWLG